MSCVYPRLLDLRTLLKAKSHFLFGPRGTGKTWLTRKQLPKAQTFDLLDDDVYTRLLRRPRQLGDEEEVQAEALVRRVDHFARFLDVVGVSSGRELNFEEIARDAAVPPRTIANFIQVLKDTLLAFELPPFTKAKKRKVTSKSKLYLFDVGVANFMAGRHVVGDRGESFGTAFEHFILQEIRARLSYAGLDWPMQYWRTQRGEFEVDCILGQEMAIEIKATSSVQDRDLKGLRALKSEAVVKRYYLVSQDQVKRTVDDIQIMPWTAFLSSVLPAR